MGAYLITDPKASPPENVEALEPPESEPSFQTQAKSNSSLIQIKISVHL
jgi:hypothetical protein